MTRLTAIVRLTGGLALAVAVPGCGGPLDGSGASKSPGESGPHAHVWPTIGNPKYDTFFREVAALERAVADAEAALDRAATALRAAMKATEATDVESAFKSATAKLEGKVTLTVSVTPTGPAVNVVAVPGVTLSVDDQALVEAYRQAATEIAGLPTKLEPVVRQSVAIGAQVGVLVAGAKKDFSGKNAGPTLVSVIQGLTNTADAMQYIQAHAPPLIEKSRTLLAPLGGNITAAQSGQSPQPAQPGQSPQPAQPGQSPQPAQPGQSPQPASPASSPAGTWESYCAAGNPQRILHHVTVSGNDFLINEQNFHVRAAVSGQTVTGAWWLQCGPRPCAAGRIEYLFDPSFQTATYRFTLGANPTMFACTYTRKP